MCCKFLRGFLRLAGLCLLLTGPASLSPLHAQTNPVTATFSFGNLTGNPQGIVSFSLIPEPTLSGSNFILSTPIRFTIANYPGLTNGSVTTPVLAGVNFRAVASDGYSLWTTNFYFQPSDAGTAMQAFNRACIITPSGVIAYTSPNITNYIIGGGGGTASNSPAVSSNDPSILINPTLLGTGATNYNVGVNGKVVATNNTPNAFTFGGNLQVNGSLTATLTGNASSATIATTATSLSGTLSASQLTGTAPLAVLPPSVPTNNFLPHTYVFSTFNAALANNGMFILEGYDATNLFYGSITPLAASASSGVSLPATPVYSDPNATVNFLQTPKITYYNGTFLVCYQAIGVTNSAIGIASSPDLFHWQYLGQLNLPVKTNFLACWSPDWVIDATNGLHMIFAAATNVVDTSPSQFLPWTCDIYDQTFIHQTNLGVFNIEPVYTNFMDIGYTVTCVNGSYWLAGSGGYLFENQNYSTNGWSLVVKPSASGPASVITNSTFLNFSDSPYIIQGYQNRQFTIFDDTYGITGYWQSPDGTNWIYYGNGFNNAFAFGEGKVISILGPINGQATNLTGTFSGSHSGDGSRLTNQPYLKTMTVTGGTVSFSVNSDGSSNASLTISGGAGSGNANTNNSAQQYWNGQTNTWQTVVNFSNTLNTTGVNINTNGNINASGTITGTHSGGGAGLTGLTAGNLTGNVTVPVVNGTSVTNNQPSVTVTNMISATGGVITGNGAGVTNATASLLSITNTDLYAGGNNSGGAEITVTNANKTSWAGTTVQADDGSYAVPTNYAGVYKNNSAYPYASGSIGTTNDGIIENNGGNLIFDTIGPAPHYYFGSRVTYGTSFATNEFDLSLAGAVFSVTITGNGSGLTSLNASALTSGTVPAAQLPYPAQGGNAQLTNVANGFGPQLSAASATNLWGTLNRTNLPPFVTTNQTAVASSTNLLGTDSGGNQVAVPWANIPSGGGSSTPNAALTNQVNVFTSSNNFTAPVLDNYSILIGNSGCVISNGAAAGYGLLVGLNNLVGYDQFNAPAIMRNGGEILLGFSSTVLDVPNKLYVGGNGSESGSPNGVFEVANGDAFFDANSHTAGGSATGVTNRLYFTSVSSLTNTLGWDANAIISAGTSVSIQDTNGNAIATLGTIATLDEVVPLRVNMRIAGTGVTAILY